MWSKTAPDAKGISTMIGSSKMDIPTSSSVGALKPPPPISKKKTVIPPAKPPTPKKKSPEFGFTDDECFED
tara:strand:- start:212 stop:424 length:213 start_codon:yes stop_codon:yes gene_type:complete